ncbi:AAA family ATPase [Amycolatopsis sp. H20-H5]|uniref:AAA family ATPase n=1 Tax=Amycolatopsis sp. H20-H5 TaxID=3046309 RepID=UPI002DB94905|nr:AAA family ATPase [Amycolatopsis sp. H20-H5]MEC3978914.1 AAA family ATPase [Amycolatopsis sp. H20-H5]
MQPEYRKNLIVTTFDTFIINLPNPALVILVGLQGSGKSTFAHRHFAPIEILSMDEFRARMCNDPASQSNSSPARRQLLDMLRQRLRNKVTTVVDSTNLRSDQRAQLLNIAAEFRTPTITLVFTASAEWCRERIDSRASIIRDDVLAQNADLLDQTLRDIDDEGHFVVFRLGNEQVESIRFEHAFPDDPEPDRWFEVEQLRPRAWVFRHPADELRRHPAVLAEMRPTWDFIARVAADMALGARIASANTQARAQVGAELRVRLPHCLPIHLVASQTGWERKPPHAS